MSWAVKSLGAIARPEFGEQVMVRYSPDHKSAARAEIVSLASERLRSDGIAAVGVRQLMADAGLTHGGFYAHFGSRSELVREAVVAASRSTLKYLEEAAFSAPPEDRFAAIISAYLSHRHLIQLGKGCAAAALGAELAREESNTRASFIEQNNAIIALLAKHLPATMNEALLFERATGIFAVLMGTLQLARIARDQANLEQILTAGREAALQLSRLPIGGDLSSSNPDADR